MKKHITKLYPRDKAALYALARCGHIDHKQLNEWLRDKRIACYEKDGLIKRVQYSRPGDGHDDRTAYRLTAAGRDLCRREYGLAHIYHAQSPAHDLALADRYCSLTPEQRETWQTEGDLQEHYFDKIEQAREQGEEETARLLESMWQEGKVSMPDCSYKISVQTELAFEIVTNSYGQQEIEAKERAVEILEIEYEQERV